MELKEKRNEHLGSHPGPAQSHPENISATYELSLEEIRLRAYEIHLQRGGFPGNEVLIGCKPNANSSMRRAQKDRDSQRA
jgi:hypothetical protein